MNYNCRSERKTTNKEIEPNEAVKYRMKICKSKGYKTIPEIRSVR